MDASIAGNGKKRQDWPIPEKNCKLDHFLYIDNTNGLNPCAFLWYNTFVFFFMLPSCSSTWQATHKVTVLSTTTVRVRQAIKGLLNSLHLLKRSLVSPAFIRLQVLLHHSWSKQFIRRALFIWNRKCLKLLLLHAKHIFSLSESSRARSKQRHLHNNS